MGQDKSLMPFGSAPTLIEHQLAKFRPFFDEIYLSSKSKKLAIKAGWILDESEISAPIVAIIKALKTIRSNRLFVIAVDVPFFGVEDLKKLLITKGSLVMAKGKSGVHPLTAIYSKDLLPILESGFRDGIYSLVKIFSSTAYKTVAFDEQKLMNLNYMDDYQMAIRSKDVN